MDLQIEIQRAGEARQILDSTMFQDAKMTIEGQMAHARRAVPLKDTDMHTRLILMEQLWSSLLGYLEQIAVTGRMAEMQLRAEEERRSLLDAGVSWYRKMGRNL